MFFYSCLWFASSLSIIYCYSIVDNGEIITVLNMFLQSLFGIVTLWKLPKITRYDILNIITYGGYIYTSNVSLKYTSIYTYSLFKSMLPLLSQLILYLLKIEKMDFVIILLYGVAMLATNTAQIDKGSTKETKTLGFLYLFLFTLFGSIKLIYCKKTLVIRTPLEMIKDIDFGISILLSFTLIPNLLLPTSPMNWMSVLFVSVITSILGLLSSYAQWNLLKINTISTFLFLELIKSLLTIVIGSIQEYQYLTYKNIAGIMLLSTTLSIYYLLKIK